MKVYRSFIMCDECGYSLGLVLNFGTRSSLLTRCINYLVLKVETERSFAGGGRVASPEVIDEEVEVRIKRSYRESEVKNN